MKTLIIVSSVVLGLSGCATCNTPLTNLTPESGLQENQRSSHDSNRKIQVTMTNGEVLIGTLQDIDVPIRRNGSNLMPAVEDGGGAYSFLLRDSDLQKQVHALLKSTTPDSALEIEIIGVYRELDGHGFGKARTNDGRYYELQFEML